MLLSQEISLLTHPHVSSSWNTALIPEEAESALEAAHYFTEDSSSEGESLLRHLAQPPVCRKPAVPLWAPWEGPATLPGPGWPCRLLTHCFSCISVSPDLGFSLCPLRILCCPFQHLLWPQIWIFSCPGRHKVSPWRAGAIPLTLGFVFFYSKSLEASMPQRLFGNFILWG